MMHKPHKATTNRPCRARRTWRQDGINLPAPKFYSASSETAIADHERTDEKVMSLEKPLLDVQGEVFAKMSDKERAEALYTGTHKLIGNSSKWKKEHPAEAKRARAIARNELGVSIGLDPEERAEERRRNATMHPPKEEKPQQKAKRVPQPPITVDERVAAHVGIVKGADGQWRATWEQWEKYRSTVAALQP